MFDNISKFNGLTIGDRFIIISIGNGVVHKLSPYIKVGPLLYTNINERGESIGTEFTALWKTVVCKLTLEKALEEYQKNVIATIIK